METSLSIFEEKSIRKVWHNDEWWFSVTDVIAALTESSNPRDYWYKMKIRVQMEDQSELSTLCRQLKLRSSDGKKYETDCANTEGLFRIIQSIPSPKAEPFKLWLAKVGYERVKEIENPELGMERTRKLYQMKGYPESWIEIRMRGKKVRDELTDEWQKRDVKEGLGYKILTAEIAQATFGMTPKQHKEFKGLQRENLRDHMTNLELIFTMLGEASTSEIAKEKDARGFDENKVAARKDGKIAGGARKKLEKETGKKVATRGNALGEGRGRKRLS